MSNQKLVWTRNKQVVTISKPLWLLVKEPSSQYGLKSLFLNIALQLKTLLYMHALLKKNGCVFSKRFLLFKSMIHCKRLYHLTLLY